MSNINIRSSCSSFFTQAFDISNFHSKTRSQKILIVAFHALTIGIPLAIHQIHRTLKNRAKKISPAPVDNPITPVESLSAKVAVVGKTKSTSNKKNEISLTSPCKSALKFAKKELKKHPDLEPKVFTHEILPMHQPVDKTIGLLSALYDIYLEEFKDALQQHENPWTDPESTIVPIADKLMKVSYAISQLTLQDLESFRETYPFVANLKNSEILLKESVYMRKTLFYCTDIYHQLRCQMGYENNVPAFPEKIDEGFAQKFYDESAQAEPHFQWRILYNDFCQSLKNYVNLENFKDKVMYGDYLFYKDRCLENFANTTYYIIN